MEKSNDNGFKFTVKTLKNIDKRKLCKEDKNSLNSINDDDQICKLKETEKYIINDISTTNNSHNEKTQQTLNEKSTVTNLNCNLNSNNDDNQIKVNNVKKDKNIQRTNFSGGGSNNGYYHPKFERGLVNVNQKLYKEDNNKVIEIDSQLDKLNISNQDKNNKNINTDKSKKELVTQSTSTFDDSEIKNLRSCCVSTDDFISYSNYERTIVNEMIQSFDKLREENIQIFEELINEIKIIDTITREYRGDLNDIKKMKAIYDKSKNRQLLAFSSYKAVRYSILEICDPDLCHMFFAHMRVVLRGESYKNILCEYLISLSDIDFMNCDEEEVKVYITLLELMIHCGNCDINAVESTNLNSPLHIAVQLRQYQFVILLVKNGSFTFMLNMNNMTCLDLCLELSEKYSKILNEVINTIPKDENSEVIKKLENDDSGVSISDMKIDESTLETIYKYQYYEMIYTRISQFLISINAERNKYVENYEVIECK